MIYCVAIAGVWQTSGFVMAMFLAGLRGVGRRNPQGGAQIDGASTYQTYRRIVIPIMRPGVPVGDHRARAYGDQILRPRALRHRQEPRRRRGTAVDLHVLLHLHPQSDGGRLDKRRHHADGRSPAIMVPYLYSELREKPR